MSAAGGTVFIIDDDPSIRRSLERLFRIAGYPVQIFVSARQFLEEGDLSEAACLVLDVRMPGPSGLELQHLLEAGGHDIPVIFITGHADAPMAEQALRAGAVDLLAKPFDGQALLEAVERAISARNRSKRGMGGRAEPDCADHDGQSARDRDPTDATAEHSRRREDHRDERCAEGNRDDRTQGQGPLTGDVPAHGHRHHDVEDGR
jgi:DNA-binding NtrC family response regulator